MGDNPGDNREGRVDMVRDREDISTGEAIRRSRLEQGMTQFELAVKGNIRGGASEISKYEKGTMEPNLANWFKLCKALDWPLPFERPTGTEDGLSNRWSRHTLSDLQLLWPQGFSLEVETVSAVR
jgi:transcriptional regulator with XRE-family HTH domain